MKNFIHKTSGCFSITAVVFFLIGCVGEPVKFDLPAKHPANPQAPETAFTAAPNPFQERMMPMAGQEAGSRSSMAHEQHPSTDQPHMKHQMDQIEHGSRSSQDAEDENQHKEHSQ
jgi:hypothetical protein